MKWLVGLLLVAGPVGAQIPIPPPADTLTMWVVRGADTLPVGRQVHHFSVRQESGVPLLFRAIFTDAVVFGPRIDTLISHLGSGLPVRYVAATPRTIERVDVSGGRARGQVRGPDSQLVNLDIPVPEGTIHAANIDLALRRLLLPIGDIVTLRLFIPNTTGGGEVQMRVEGVETIGAERAWRIRALNLANGLTLWISQQDRSLVQQTMVGPNGVQLLFDRRPLPITPVRP